MNNIEYIILEGVIGYPSLPSTVTILGNVSI